MNQGLLGNLNLKFEFQQVDCLAYLFGFHGEHIFLFVLDTDSQEQEVYEFLGL